MKLLLDTHVWLWSLMEPRNLGRRVTRALRAADSELWLSSISVWETLVLSEKGRVALHGDPQAWVREALASSPVRQAPLTHEIAQESRLVDLRHEDPADRFLAATARVLELTLVTADHRLINRKACSVLANR